MWERITGEWGGKRQVWESSSKKTQTAWKTHRDNAAATMSQDPRTCFVFVRITERRRRASYMYVWNTGMMCALLCVMSLVYVCVCVWDGGWRDSRGKEPRLSLQKSLSCVIGAAPLSPRYLHAQTGYRFLCAGWLCNRHQVSATQLWPAFLIPLPPSELIWNLNIGENHWWVCKKPLLGALQVEKTWCSAL